MIRLVGSQRSKLVCIRISRQVAVLTLVEQTDITKLVQNQHLQGALWAFYYGYTSGAIGLDTKMAYQVCGF